MTAAIIELDHLQKNFGKFTVLKDVSFTLALDQALGLLGPNGADESTTIRIILGLLKKNGDLVIVLDKDIWWNDTAIHPRIAYVPRNVYLRLNFSGGETTDLLLRLNGRQHNQRTSELVKVFEFDPKRKAYTYSKGSRQKVASVTTLSQDADLHISDEPTSGPDLLNERTFQQEVLKPKGAGRNVLLSSRISSKVKRVCGSIVIIRGGSVIESNNLDQLRYLSRIEIGITTATPITTLAKQAGVHGLTYRDSEHTKAVFTADRDASGTTMIALTANTVVDM